MDSQNSTRSWKILKYKQLKRENREEYDDVALELDESKKRLVVTCKREELEQIYYNMDVKRYPSLKMKGAQLYVMVNGQRQGFRLTFRDQDRQGFLEHVRNLTFISETPEKLEPSRMDWRTNEWTSETVKTANTSFHLSSSQPQSTRRLSPPRKSPACRNLSQEMAMDYNRNYKISKNEPDFRMSHSQPVYDIYSRPPSIASSISSSIGSVGSSFFDDSPKFSDDSRPSSQSSVSSSQYTSLQQSSNQYSSSQNSCDVFDKKVRITPTENKCVQTEITGANFLLSNPSFQQKIMKRKMMCPDFLNLVKKMRVQIRRMPAEKLEEFRRKTDPTRCNTFEASSQPSVPHQSSDLEIIFD